VNQRALGRIVGHPEVEPMFSAHPNRLRHELLEVTLAYLKGKDAKSEEVQEDANGTRLAMYA
jgi:hypothetical protein